MQRLSLTPFGRQPVSVAQVARLMRLDASPALPAVAKYPLLDALRVARAGFGIGSRELIVVHALLSFVPGTELREEAGLVVYASNAALSERAHGMADSTLRRHLATLVRVGLIARHDSPNGKRFACREGGRVTEAYGLDLRPFVARAPEILTAAEAVRAEEASLHKMRRRLVLALRDAWSLSDLAGGLGAAELLAQSRGLRRKMTRSGLEAGLAAVETLLAALRPTAEMSPTDSQTERHHTETKKDSFDSESAIQPVSVAEVLEKCPDVVDYAPEPIRRWDQLCDLTGKLAPMLGIAPRLWARAAQTLGRQGAGLALSVILQRLKTIRRPDAYLAALISRHLAGKFDPVQMLRGFTPTAS